MSDKARIDETYLIEKYFNRRVGESPVLGIGDDAAVFDCPDRRMVVSADTMVEGVHFQRGDDADDVGYKALATSLSDLAAMGARPHWALLCLTLPAIDESWLKRFSDGFFSLAEHYRVGLIGGDMTSGHLTISVQVIGTVQSEYMARSKAAAGHGVYVTGQLGIGGFAHLYAERLAKDDPLLLDQLMARYKKPDPRITQGEMICRYAPCAIDISDGVLMDLSRVLAMSAVGATVELKGLPMPDRFSEYCKDDKAMLAVLGYGEDYELLFTMEDAHYPALQKDFETDATLLTRIGTVEAELGLRCTDDGQPVTLPTVLGYDHFAK